MISSIVSNIRGMSGHAKVVVGITIVVVALLAAGLWVGTSIRDSVFDKIEAAKMEQVGASEQAAQQHEASAKALIAQVSDLKGQVTQLKVQVMQSSGKILATERSRQSAEQELAGRLGEVAKPIGVADRCKRACENMRQLGLVAADADCGCN